MEKHLNRRFRHVFNFRLPLRASFILIYISLCASNLFAANDDYSTWKYSGRLYLNTTNTGANVSSDNPNFPVLIRLTSSNFSFGEAKLDGSDFRVAKSDGTHLPYEIERWDYSNKLAEVWVGVDTVYGNNSSQYIVAYWGKGGAADSGDGTKVFLTTDGHIGVWHLSEDPSGGAGSIKDATSNAGHGTPNNMAAGDLIDGPVGKGHNFVKASTQYHSIAHNAAQQITSDLTISFWITYDFSGLCFVIEKGDTDDDNYAVYLDASGTLKFEFEDSGGTYRGFSGDDDLTTGWHHVAITFDDSGDKLYWFVDGLPMDTIANTYTLAGDQTFALNIAAQEYGGIGYALNGDLDEVRLNDVERSADWIKLSYQNQQTNDSLVVGDLRHEDYDSWAYSKTFFLNTTDAGANVTGNVTAFPVLIRLHSVNFTFSEALSGGADIRFAKSDGTHLKYEIERWDATNSLAEIWVKADTVYGNNQTQFFKMYWGKSGETSNSNSEAVFETSDSFEGIYHLEEDGNTTASGYVDATNKSNDGTGVSMTSSSDVTANIGTGQTFDGSADYIILANETNFDITAAITYSAWIKVTNWDINYQAIIAKGDGAWRISRNGGNNPVHIGLEGTSGGTVDGTVSVNDGQWHHVVGVYNGSNSYIYVDGVQDVTEASTGSITNNSYAVWIGNNSQQTGRYFDGIIDEVRVSTAARSADYIKLSYMNQREGDLLVVEDMSEWTYSRAVLFNTETSGAGITTTVTDFPVLIRLHAGNFTFSETQTSGQDIRFRESDGDALAYEIERWDNTNKLAEIWVRIPSISGNSTTEYINMYWGNANAKDLSYEEQVFEISNNFRGVWHLNEDGNTTTDGYDDASGNDDDATGTSMTSSSDVTGLIGIGQDFDGTADYLYASGVNLPTADFTYSTWVKLDAVNDEDILMASNTAGDNEVGIFVDPDFDWNIDNSSPTGTDNTAVAGTWYHFALTRSSGTATLYVNGISEQSTTDNDSLAHNSCGLLFGTDSDTGCNGGLGNWMDGIMDEPRVSAVARSADWLKLQYMNQKAIPQFADAEDYSQWTYTANIDINTTASGANVSGNVADFPMLLRFTSDNFTFTEALDGGTDLRFAGSGGEHLAFEVERWDSTNALGEVWVKMHSVLGNNNTQYIKMFWGNTSATARSDGGPVFSRSDDYEAVYHLNTNANDASYNIQHGTNNGADAITGNIAGGMDFIDENSDDVTVPVAVLNNLDNDSDGENPASATVTVSLWLNGDAAEQPQTNWIFQANVQNFSAEVPNGSANIYWDAGGTGCCGDRATKAADNAEQYEGNWGYWTFTKNGTALEIFYNGASWQTATGTNADIGDITAFRFGSRNGTSYYEGAIDEFRISSAVRSDDFIKLSYETQKSTQVAYNLKDDLTTWTYSRNMFMNTQSSGANVSGNVLNFPLLIRLKDESFDFTQAQGSGQDIRFSKSNGDQLDYEIERWDSTNALAEIWVMVDTVYGNNSSQYIKMYWGNSTATSRSDGAAVFSTANGFAGVWHMGNDPSGGSNAMKDATANQNHGTSGGSMTTGDLVTGYVGQAIDFDGADDNINVGSDASLDDLDNVTVSGWINPTGWGENNFGRLFDKTELIYYISNAVNLETFRLVRNRATTNTDVDIPDNTVNLSEWIYITATMFSTDSSELFKNGIEPALNSNAFGSGALTTDASADLYIGNRLAGDRAFSGLIDELRISSVNRSADWAKLSYENQKANNSLVGVEDYNTWNHKTNIYINTEKAGANTSADVLAFPYLVRLDSFNFNFSQAQTNGEDLRFSKSDGVHISYEIERWDATNEVAEIWVKMDTVYDQNTTQYFSMYWGKSTAADHQNSENVFSTTDNFEGVWHLEEDGNTTTDGYVDATGNNLHGTGVSMTTSSDVSGNIGLAQDFDVGNDRISIPANTQIGNLTNTLTVSAWVNNDALSGQDIFFGAATATTTNGFKTATSGTDVRFTTWGVLDYEATDMTLTTGSWYHYAVILDASFDATFYINGDEVIETETHTVAGNVNTDDVWFIAGQAAEPWDGKIDEVRVSSVVRSADWFKLSYYNQRSSDVTTIITDDLTEWPNSKRIFINTQSTGANVSSDKENFSIPVRFTSSNFKFNEAMSDGADIRFSKSDGTALAYEIERWDNVNELGEIWVRIDTVYGSNATQYFNVHWGRPNSINRSNGESVFGINRNHELILHLGEEGNTTTDGYKDATANNYHGTGTSMTSESNVTGVIGIGQEFDGSADFITNTGYKGVTGTASRTMMAWVKIDGDNNDLVSWGTNVAGSKWIMRVTSGGQLRNEVNSGHNEGTTNIEDGTWHHVAVVLNDDGSPDATEQILYVDGVLETSGGSAAEAINTTNTQDVRIALAHGNNYLDGSMDEIQISSTDRNADYIKLSYETQKAAQTAICFEEDFYQDWSYRQDLTLNTSPSGANVTSDVTDFPVLIRLTSGNFTFSQAQGSGQDLRFTKSDRSPLFFEIERWDSTNAVAEIWVRVDTVYATNSTQSINMFWGNSTASSKSNANAVFDVNTNFAAVWHLEEDGNTTADGYEDATDNKNHGTGVSTTTSSDIDGIIGRAQDLDGTADYIDITTATNLGLGGTQKFTISGWARPDAATHTGRILTKYNSGVTGEWRMSISSGQFIVGKEVTPWVITGTTVATSGTWYYFTGVYDGTNMNLYVNASSDATQTAFGSSSSTGDDVYIGAWESSSSVASFFNGALDEMRISLTNRSTDWIKLSYENQKTAQTLVNFSSPPTSYSKGTRFLFNTTSSGAAVGGDVTDIPILLRIDSSHIDFSVTKSDGSDILFTDSSGAMLYHEVVLWDKGNDTALVWVKVPKVNGNSTDDYIDLHYGCGDCTNDFHKADSVWNGYTAVWHLNGGEATAEDRTSNSNDGTYNTALPFASGVTTPTAPSLDGTSDDYIDAGDISTVDGATALSVSVWIKVNDLTDDGTIVSKDIFSDPQNPILLWRDETAATSGRTNTFSVFFSDGTNAARVEAATDASSTSTWTYLTATFTASSSTGAKFYIDGVEDANSGVSTSSIAALESNANAFRMGKPTTTASKELDGQLNEVRISTAVKSSDYIKLSYENQKLTSTFLSAATINGPVPVPGLVLWLKSDSNVTKDANNYISKWEDISGKNHDATQNQTAISPLYKTNVIAGLPTVRLDGTDDYMSITSFKHNIADNVEVFAVADFDQSKTSQQDIISVRDTPGTGRVILAIDDNADELSTWATGSKITSVEEVTFTPQIYGFSNDGTDIKMYINGNLVKSSTGSATSGGGYWILGTNKSLTGEYFKGDQAEILIYDRALSSGERASVIKYLNERYFLTPKILTTLTATTNNDGNVDLGWTLPVSSSPMADTVGIWAKLNGYPDSSRNGILVGYFKTTDTNYTWSVDYPGTWHFTLLVRDTNDNWSNVSDKAQDTAAVFGNAGIKLTFNTTSTGAAVNEDQVNFPMLVRLVAADSGIFNACPNADGTHMRFIDDDGVTFLDYEVERYDNSSDLAEFWVRVPAVDGNSATDFISMEYRACNNPDASNPENVFRNADNYKAVYHLDEDGNTTASGYNDATSNNNDGTGVSLTTSSDVIANIGIGHDIDGTADYIDANDDFMDNLGAFTLSGWVYRDGTGNQDDLYGQNDALEFFITSGDVLRLWTNATNSFDFSYSGYEGGWHHVVGTGDGVNTKLYVDGVLRNTDPGTTSDYGASADNVKIGAAVASGSGNFFDGKLDEVRFSSTGRSADWIKLSYETQKSGSSVITQSLIQRIYVDSALGSDNYTCIQAENPSTPKLTMRSAAACDKHDAADTVRILVQPGTYTDSVLTAGNHDVIIQAADLNNPPILNGEMGTSPKRTLKLGNKYHLRNLIIKPRTNNNDGIVNSNNEDNFSIIGCQVINDGSIKHDVGIHIKGSGAIGILIANNIVDGATTTGIEVNSDDDVNVVHNVIYGSTTTGIDIKSTGADDITVTNNIIYNATTGIKEADADNDIGLISNNLFYNVTTQVSGGDVDDSPVTSDPLFVSTTFGDENYMKVSANSPAIDAGTNSQDPNTSFTNTATIDFWGTVRPVGSARDIGVYEGTGVSQTFTGEFDTLTTVEEGSDTVGVHTGKWAIIFRKTEGGGIADLRDKDAWATNLLGSDPLFEVNLNGTVASSVTTIAPSIISKNRVMAVVRQEQAITANFNLVVDYTIYPSGHIYVQSKLVNTSGSAQNNQTLDFLFEISAEDAGFQNAGNENGYGYLTTSTRDVYVGVTEALNLPNSLTWDANFSAANNNIVWDTDDIDFGIADEFDHHFLIYIGDEALGTDKSATIYNDTYFPQKLDVVTGTAFASESWENSLVGQWPMDEGAGSTARDVSGNTRNGTITTATYTSGKSQTSLDFTTSAYVTVSHHADFDAGNDRTYMAWVKKASTFSGSESDARFLSKGSDLILGRSTSANQVIFTAGGTTLTDPDATPNDAWFHIAGTIDAGKISRLYVNGVLKDVASAQIAAAGNSSDLLVGKNGSNTGFDGEIDDVRIYHRAFTSEDIQAVYNEGFAHKTGAYRGRASNNNRFVGIMNQTSDVGRFQPVFHIDNWYGGDVPQYVYVDGVQMSHYTDYVSIEEPHGGGGNTLILQFNKTFTGTDIDVFIDDNDSSGYLGASSIMPTIHTAVTASDQITVKNLSGSSFGNVGSKEWEFIIDLDGSTGTTDGDGGIYSWKSSEVSPNVAISAATDLTGSDSVTLDQMKFDNVALSGASWTSPDPNTYTIDDSSSTRLKISMGATTINVGTPDVVDARTYTFYPTGKIFVSHSITSISSQPTTPQIWIERLNSITASTDATSSTTPQDSARGGKLSDSNISGSFHGFGVSVLSVKSNGTTVSGQTAVTGNSNASSAFALNFNNTYFETADATITVNYMIDFTQNYTTAASLDSALQDVQQITSLTAVTGTIVTNDAMDFNTDGFAEGEGVWTYSASSGVAEFKLNATQARFHPAFKISSWNSSSLPQIVLVNNAEQVKGYHYNATVDGTNNALIIQFNKVFTGATNHILISQNASLAVTLSSFSAIGGEGVDTLKWTTESELDNLGFYVLRRIKPKVPTGKKANSEKLPYNSQKNDPLLGNNPDSLNTPILSAADLVKLDTSWKRLNKKLVPGPKGGRSSSTRKYLFIDRAVKYEVTYEYILVSVDVNNLEDYFGPVEAMPTYPRQTKLYGNYPNPFNPMTNIRFDLRSHTKLSLKIYDIRGHLIRELISPNKPLPPGQYRYTWDAKDDFGIEVPSGHYIYMFVTPRYKKARKMTLLK